MVEGLAVAPVVPVFNEKTVDYLDALVRRSNSMTTLIWGWQGDDGRASRMVEPAKLVAQQTTIPFLFSPAAQERKAVTHAAISGLVVHRDDEEYDGVASWLARHRVEHFARKPHRAGAQVKSFYVATACQALSRPIPYPKLTVVNGGTALSPEKRRGYALVWLPESLNTWFLQARLSWATLARTIPS